MEHDEVYQRITSILDGEDDWVTAMATVVCELHNAFEHYHWTGFYRTVSPGLLKIGPYQGGHGCDPIVFTIKNGGYSLVDFIVFHSIIRETIVFKCSF